MTTYSLPGRQARDSERIRALEADVRPAITGGNVTQLSITGPTKIHGHDGLGEGGVLIKPLFFEGAAPATPPANHVVVYAKADGNMYQKDDAGTETGLAGGGGGGSVATDAIWDAMGDAVRGTGANTAERLAITVPAANIVNVLGVVNGETTFSWKSLMDATVASTQAFGDAAAAGTGVLLARITHKHAMPADPVTAHAGAADPHTGYRLESADHSHASTGIQGGTLPLYQLVTRQRSITLTAQGLTSTPTNGCASPQIVEYTNNRPAYVADFDATSQEFGFWQARLADWDGGTVTFQVEALVNTTSANTFVMGLAGVCTGHGDALGTAFPAGVEVTLTPTGTANQGIVSAVSAAVTLAGTPATTELVTFRMYRDPADGSDTFANDVRLLQVIVFYTGA